MCKLCVFNMFTVTAQFQCPTCKNLMTAPITGGVFRCPTCGNQLSIPPQAAPAAIPAGMFEGLLVFQAKFRDIE